MPEQGKTRRDALGAGIAIGTGLGVAFGAAMDSMGMGLALGISIGVAIGTALSQQPKAGSDDAPEQPPDDDR